MRNPVLLVPQANRSLFFFRRLLNKQIKSTTDHVEKQYDEGMYLAAMKRFQKATKGMLPESQEWNSVRNQIYLELREETRVARDKKRKETGQIVTDSGQITDFSSYHNLLIVHYKDVESYEALNILNYFGFPINVEEEDWWGSSRKAFDFDKQDEYPFLVINSSHEEMPECDLAGRENMMAFLFNNSLIGPYKTYGAYEQQGLDFIETKLEVAVAEVMKGWGALAQFHMSPKHFKQSYMSIEGHTNVKLYCTKLISYIKQVITQERSTLSKVEQFEQLHTVLDELMDRMQLQEDGNQFHGGHAPDAADFRAYSVLQRFDKTKVMIKIIENREDRALHRWFTSMKRLCQPKNQF